MKKFSIFCCILVSITLFFSLAWAQSLPYVTTNSALVSYSVSGGAGTQVMRTGYYAAGDSPPVVYTLQASACLPAAGNGGSLVASATLNYCWILQTGDAAFNVLDFGAVADGTGSGGTDNNAFFAAALSTGTDVYVPCGRYWVTGQLKVQGNGQRFYGSNPNQNGCGTDLIADGATPTTDFIVFGNSSPSNNWPELAFFNLTMDNRVGTTGSTNANAIWAQASLHGNIHDINITDPWNGIKIDGVNTLDIRRIANTNVRGDYNEYCFDNTQVVSLQDINNSALTATATTTSSLSSSGTTTIYLSNTTNILPHQFVTQTSTSPPSPITTNIPNGATVVSVVANTSVTISTNLTGNLPSGTTLSFTNQTVGFYASTNCNSIEMKYVRSQHLYNAFKFYDSTGANLPFEFECFRCGGDSLYGTAVNNVNGIQIHFNPIYAGIGTDGTNNLTDAESGPAVSMGQYAVDMEIGTGSTIFGAKQEGIYALGERIKISNSRISQNNSGTVGASCGVRFGPLPAGSTPGVANATVTGNTIGFLNSSYGRQYYGICSDSTANAGNILVDGNDLTGNSLGPVDNQSSYTLGQNTGLAYQSPGVIWSANVAPVKATSLSGVQGWFAGLDGATNRVLMDAYGSPNSFSYRRADGTAASPTALQANDTIGGDAAFGWDSSGAYGANAAVSSQIQAVDNWTATDHGTSIRWLETDAGFVTAGAAFTLRNHHALFDGVTAPTLGSGSSDCGTSPALTSGSGDSVMRITVGSSTNGGKCTVTFGVAWGTAPACIANNETSVARPVYAIGTSTTSVAVTAGSTLTAGDKIVGHCFGF